VDGTGLESFGGGLSGPVSRIRFSPKLFIIYQNMHK
jgi:hypothetical protein